MILKLESRRINLLTANSKRRMILISAVSSFFFNSYTRFFFSGSSFNQINFLYLATALPVIIIFILEEQVEPASLYITAGFALLVFISTFFLHKSTGYYLLVLSCMIVPLCISCLRLDRDATQYIFSLFLDLYNVLCILLLLFGIADYLLNGRLQLFLAHNTYHAELGNLIIKERSGGVYRLYSFIGHPLTAAQYFLIFFCLNAINNRFFKVKLNVYLTSLITIFGLLLSGSKSALVLGLFLAVFCGNIKKNKLIYLIILFTGLIVVYNLPLFQDNLMQRYLNAVYYGDISTGRNSLLNILIRYSDERPGLFFGGGVGYSRVVARNLLGSILNFEYPFIMMAFDYSILGVLLIYAVIFVNPVICFIKSKSFFIVMCFLIITIYINGNNGLANFSDIMGQLCFVIMLFRNVAVNYSGSPTEEVK